MIAPDSLKRIAAWSRELNEREIEVARAGIIEKSYRAGEFIFMRGDPFEYWTGVVTGLARMDRALLRCAISEVLHSATPARVAIAEWVELARIYSGDPMRRLMNGVLGRIARETELQNTPSSEEGVSGQHLRPTQEDRRRAARRR